MFKTRSQATKACQLGRVKVNGARAKPHRPLSLDDRVEVEKGDWTRILVVKELQDRPLPKAEASRVYEDESPPRPERDPVDRWAHRSYAARESGLGRPTKKERREIDRFRR